MSEIAGRHILVTGGASGIGRLTALRMAARGGRVSVWDIHTENLDRVVAELGSAGCAVARGWICDVSKRESVYAAARETLGHGGPVDVLVNNAGVVSGKGLLEIPDEKIEATFAINTLSLFWTAKAFLPAMIEQRRGHIVTIASASSLIGVARLADYAASKWAAMGFDESLRAELRRSAPALETTVVCPFFIDTGMFRGVKSRFPRLLPILDENDVADRIVDAVERNRRRVVMPPIVHWIPLLRVLPVGVFDALATFLGVNASMDEFKGRAAS
ncbi:MAG: SDR family oxidoreductase [Deltaproteobacteria bacterium]|nr:SDR family oxidoreductase [Deltaproteobacteria bacterium]